MEIVETCLFGLELVKEHMKFSTFVTLLRNMLYPIVVIVRHKKTAYGSRLELLLFAFRVIKPSKSQEMALRARSSGN